jgi:hypothetical protein
VHDLEVQRPIHQGTALDAQTAADAQGHVDRVFVEPLPRFLFDELAHNRAGRTELILGRRVDMLVSRGEVTGADVAVTAHLETLHAFDGRFIEHALGGAVATANTLVGVDLPPRFRSPAAASGQKSHAGAERQHAGHTH